MASGSTIRKATATDRRRRICPRVGRLGLPAIATQVNVATCRRAGSTSPTPNGPQPSGSSPGPLGYFDGGAGDEETLRENVAAWRRWRLRAAGRSRDVTEVATACEVLGGPVAMPILVAPVAFQRLVHPEGELAMARAAADAGDRLLPLDPGDDAAAPRSPPRRRRAGAGSSSTASATRRHPGADARRRSPPATRRSSSPSTRRPPATASATSAPASGSRPRSAFPASTPRSAPVGRCTIAEAFELMDRSLDWEDLGDLAADAGLPVIVKGVLAAEDAALAVEHGAAAVVVSNHGGRQLDRCPATAEVLAEVGRRGRRPGPGPGRRRHPPRRRRRHRAGARRRGGPGRPARALGPGGGPARRVRGGCSSCSPRSWRWPWRSAARPPRGS